MAITKTSRLGLTRWSSDDDEWDRQDWDDDNAALEAQVGIDVEVADFPALVALTPKPRMTAWVRNAKRLYRWDDDVDEWAPVGGAGMSITDFEVPGDELDMAGLGIVNVAAAGGDNDAVNYGQLKALGTPVDVTADGWGLAASAFAITPGNMTVRVWEQRIGRQRHISGLITIGSTTVIPSGATSICITIPALSGPDATVLNTKVARFDVTYRKASTGYLVAGIGILDPAQLLTPHAAGSNIGLYAPRDDGADAGSGNASLYQPPAGGVAPFTWATNDRIHFAGVIPTA